MCKPKDPTLEAEERKWEQLARKFSDKIAMTHTSEECELIIKRNREEDDPHICHSHDFCDANELMMMAYCEVYAITEDEFDMTPETISRINEAWAIAKTYNFWFSEEEQ